MNHKKELLRGLWVSLQYLRTAIPRLVWAWTTEEKILNDQRSMPL